MTVKETDVVFRLRDHQSNLNTRLDADAREAVPGNGRMPTGDPVRL